MSTSTMEAPQKASTKRVTPAQAAPKKGKKKTKKRAVKAASPSPKREEVDLTKIDEQRARERLESIYRLERSLERAKDKLERASAARRAAKIEHDEAVAALEQEIQDQRFGPGPLYPPEG